MVKGEFPRLSAKEFRILDLLIHSGEMFGLEMVEASDNDLRRGTIYVTLARMCEKGYIDSRKEERQSPEIGIARRIYWITGLGESTYKANVRALEIFRELAYGGII